jgi:hypothetical protein
MTVTTQGHLSMLVMFRLLRIAICDLLHHLNPHKIFHRIWLLQTGMWDVGLYHPWMTATFDLQFLLKNESVVLHLHCKNALLILRLLGQMIASHVSLVLKSEFHMLPLLAMIDQSHMMIVLFVLVLLIELLDQLTLFDLLFRTSVAQTTALCDLGQLVIGLYDQSHPTWIVFLPVGPVMAPFLFALPRWFVMILVCSGRRHRHLQPVTIVLERFREIEI